MATVNARLLFLEAVEMKADADIIIYHADLKTSPWTLQFFWRDKIFPRKLRYWMLLHLNKKLFWSET